MSGVSLAILSARFGDLVHEAREELDEDEFDDLLVMFTVVISRSIADRIEERWQDGSW